MLYIKQLRNIEVSFLFRIEKIFDTYVWVSLSVVTDHDSPPKVIDTTCAAKYIGVVELVVVSHPSSDESPHSFPSWVSSESRHFLWFSTYIQKAFNELEIWFDKYKFKITYQELVYCRDP